MVAATDEVAAAVVEELAGFVAVSAPFVPAIVFALHSAVCASLPGPAAIVVASALIVPAIVFVPPGDVLPFPSAGFPSLVEIGPAVTDLAAPGLAARKDPIQVAADPVATVAVSVPFVPAIAFGLPRDALALPSGGFPNPAEIGLAETGLAAAGQAVPNLVAVDLAAAGQAVPNRVAVDLVVVDLAATVVVSTPFVPAIAFELPVGAAHPAASVLAIAFALLPAARASFPGILATVAA